MENIKEEARKLIDRLPENSTWDDLMYQIYVRQTVEAGLADSKAGKVTSVQEVRRKFGLPEWKFIGQKQNNENLSAIYAYVAQTSTQYASRVIDRITKRSEQIANFPVSGRIVPEFETEQIREVLEGWYRIIYYIKSEQIYVLAVIHGSQ